MAKERKTYDSVKDLGKLKDLLTEPPLLGGPNDQKMKTEYNALKGQLGNWEARIKQVAQANTPVKLTIDYETITTNGKRWNRIESVVARWSNQDHDIVKNYALKNVQ
jgi:hypothetical protein